MSRIVVPPALPVADYLAGIGRRSKYHAVPVEVDGHRFASKREAARYAELCLLGQAGEIYDLVCQPRFTLLVPVLRDHQPSWIGVGFYTADFEYETKDGTRVIEDVKSKATRTTAYRLRKRMVEATYGITITEVD